jgi:FAD/FMN-containing dehydrogenase
MFTPADDSFAATLAATLPQDTLKRAEPRYLTEPRGKWTGASQWVALPRSTQEVAQMVRACAASNVPLIPYGGGTGLVGGQTTPALPALVLSLERMTKIRSVHPQENTLTVEAGAILADVQAAAEGVDRLFPLSLASEGSARIGGLLGTNAGGVNTLRYGNARDLVLGLEAVLLDGQIWNGLKRLRKDNTGYDLRHLLIGSEGSLGVITTASLKLFPRPAQYGTAVLTTPSPETALDLLGLARSHVGDQINAFELMHRQGPDFIRETLPDLRLPWQDIPEWSVLIDLGLGRDRDPQDALEAIFADAYDKGIVTDGVIAQSQAQRQALWSLREHIPEANKRIGSISSHDIALPLGVIADFIRDAGPRIAEIGPFRINCFGHLGDGNLHYNVFPPKGESRDTYKAYAAQIQSCVHDLVHRYEGSFSAEHGVGRLKTADLERYGDPAKLAAMRAIKAALDPQGIMNPGVMLA